MKQLFLSLGMLLLLFKGAPIKQHTTNWKGTYQCWQLISQTGRVRTTQQTSLEIQLYDASIGSVVTIRDLKSRKLRKLRVTHYLGQKPTDVGSSLGFKVKELDEGSEGILALTFINKKLAAVSLLGTERTVTMLVFYPIYLKV